MHEREEHTSGPEGRLVLMVVVRAKARTYPNWEFFRNLYSFSAPTSGKLIRIVVPIPNVLSTAKRPPCRSTISFEM